MVKNSWPFAVTSWADTVKFAQLLFGVDVLYENYAERLPHRSEKSFLLFAKGACVDGKSFCEIGNLIVPQLEEIQQWETQVRGNSMRPTKSQQMLASDKRTVYYWSAQVTRAPCLCRSSFGADAHQKHVPTSSSMWNAGNRFEKLWDATLMKNYAAFQNRDMRPIWLDKPWQVLWNWNDHNQNHGISPHSDESFTYSNVDPITSLSFGHGGVLTLGPKKGTVTKMLFQEGGDALVMAGDFQAEFCHGVPARSTWKQLQSLSMFTSMNMWEKAGLEREIALHEDAAPGAKHVRMNCTVRWHSRHWAGCPVRVQEGDGTQPVSTEAVQTRGADAWLSEASPSGSAGASASSVSVSARAATSTQGTQPVLTGAVRVPAASMVDPKQSLQLAGIKKRRVTAELTPSASSVKTSRSGEEVLLERVDETIKILLDCVAACVRQNNLFTLAIAGTPLVARTQVHDKMLAMIDDNVKDLRAWLLSASEAVEAMSRGPVEPVHFKTLNLMELAAQQRRNIHRDLGSFYTSEQSSWLIETATKAEQNCLSQYPQYRKCLLTHRQLELLLETLSKTLMEKHGEIAFDLRSLQPGDLPSQLPCARRHEQAKQHRNQNLGLDVYDVASESVLLVKALEIGYVRDLAKSTRLQTVTGAWRKLLEEVTVGEIVGSLKQGLLTLLHHLRTMDVDRNFCDRTTGELVSENYDIWVWMTKVRH